MQTPDRCATRDAGQRSRAKSRWPPEHVALHGWLRKPRCASLAASAPSHRVITPVRRTIARTSPLRVGVPSLFGLGRNTAGTPDLFCHKT